MDHRMFACRIWLQLLRKTTRYAIEPYYKRASRDLLCATKKQTIC